MSAEAATEVMMRRPRSARTRAVPRTLVIGSAIVVVMVLVAIVGRIFLHSRAIEVHLDQTLMAPSWAHPFGTDDAGRDVFARVLVGAWYDLQIGLFTVVPTLVAGVAIGLVAGYFGGWAESAITRLVDVVVAFPFFVLVIAIIAALGPSIVNMYIAVALVGWVSYAVLVRAEIRTVRQLDYIDAARALGYSHWRILRRHVLPNVVIQPLVYSTSAFVAFIMLGSALGYLGLGVQPPTPEWGVMIAGGRNFIYEAPWITIFPGIAIVLVSVAFLMIGDGLAELLRPEVRR